MRLHPSRRCRDFARTGAAAAQQRVPSTTAWPGERWLDVARVDVLRLIMEARADIASARGADAIEWGNVNVVENAAQAGVTVSEQQQACSKTLADIAPARGRRRFTRMPPWAAQDVDHAILEPSSGLAIRRSGRDERLPFEPQAWSTAPPTSRVTPHASDGSVSLRRPAAPHRSKPRAARTRTPPTPRRPRPPRAACPPACPAGTRYLAHGRAGAQRES